MNLSSSPKLREMAARDRSVYYLKPKWVAQPKDEREVQELVLYAREKGLSISPRGGGTGLSGAALGKDIVVDFSKHFTHVKKIGTITRVQSGILLKTFRPMLEKKGYMLPSVPLHGDCAIGGNVNTRSVGPRTVKYGQMQNQVVRVRGVMADGSILDTRKTLPKELRKKILDLRAELMQNKKLVKHIRSRPMVAGGYYLNAFLESKNPNQIITKLMCGSAGTLLLLTEIDLKLPKNVPIEDLYLVYCDSYKSLQKCVNAILKMKPASVEYAGKMSLETWDKTYHHPLAQGVLIVGFEGKKKLDSISKYALEIRKIPNAKKKHLWKSRQLALPRLEEAARKQGLSVPSGIDDTSIHPQDFAAVLEAVERYAHREKVQIASFGHIGVGSIHLRAFLDMKKHPASLRKVGLGVFSIVKKHRGTLIGEHDAGRCRSHFLPLESKDMYAFMKKVKKAFDPEDMLNPHVMFNLEPITKHLRVKA